MRSLLRRDAGTTDAPSSRSATSSSTPPATWPRRGDRELDLTAKEFALLRYFMTHAGEVLSQETLLEHVWDEHADPFTNTVRVTVGTLRRKLAADDEPQLIETVVGRGYRLRRHVTVDAERRRTPPQLTWASAASDLAALIYSRGAVPAGRRWRSASIYLALGPRARANEPAAACRSTRSQPVRRQRAVAGHRGSRPSSRRPSGSPTRARSTAAHVLVRALLVLFVASFGVGWLVAGYVLRPIGRITGVAREIPATDLSRRIDLGGPDDELRQLADTFDDMLGRLDEAFASQRQFIQEASHELRNPLAVIRTNLEVTLADPTRTTEDLRHTAEVVERSTERMSRLVDDLLLYARNETPALEREPVDAASLVREAADEFQAPAEARGLHLVSSAAAGSRRRSATATRCARRWPTCWPTPPAWRPSGIDGRASAPVGEGPWVWLAVDDQGPGIAPEDQDARVPAVLAGPTRRRATAASAAAGSA